MAADNNYIRSVASTRNVGRNVAMVIDHMVTKRNANLEDIHIIGHSLGAHTAGFSGNLTIIRGSCVIFIDYCYYSNNPIFRNVCSKRTG